MPHVSSPELLALHGLRVKGMADSAAVAERFAVDRELVEELLLDYERWAGSVVSGSPILMDGH